MVGLPLSGATTVMADEFRSSESSPPKAWIRNLGLYCWALLAIGTAIGAWSVATPLMAAPDEPAHAVEAAAAVRGQLELRSPSHVVHVPAWVASTEALPACYIYFPAATAACSPRIASGTQTVVTETQFTNYPPLYYLFVGIPSLVAHGAPAIYAMRTVGSLVNSALIALGLFLVIRYHPRRLLFAGVLVALSPMVFFLSSVLNSSGMEIAAAFAAWCGGLCVIAYRPVPFALGAWTALAFAVLMLSRPTSPANAAVIVVTLGIVAGWSRCKELVRDRGTFPIRFSLAVTVIVVCVQAAFGGFPAIPGTPLKPPLSLWGEIWLSLRLTEDRLRQAIGDFGWLQVALPDAVFAVWSAVVAALVAAGLYVSSRYRRALPFLALVIVLMPIIIESPKIDTAGAFWQGRYWLPVLIGVPLVAAAQLPVRKQAADRTVASGLVALGCVLGAAQVWAFVVALHRYEYGLGARPGTKASWVPPGGALLVTGLFVVGMVFLLGFIAFAATAAPEGRLVGQLHNGVPVGARRRSFGGRGLLLLATSNSARSEYRVPVGGGGDANRSEAWSRRRRIHQPRG
jgi:hypothetical protein